MQTNLRAATAKARLLLTKLESLAERGIDGEKAAARNKIARLKARFDFSVPEQTVPLELFSGSFKRSATARRICSFGKHELDLANAVKWAIETAAHIPCIYRDGDLLAEATPGTAERLREIAGHIALSFRALLAKFGEVEGVGANDRSVFIMGLYDGMMNEARKTGQRLPNRAPAGKVRKAKKGAVARASGLHIHPYTVALDLGKQIRFAAPLAQITAELEAVAQKHLASAAAAGPQPG